MKRSNRLLIIAGVVLAALAFVAVLLLGGGTPAEPPPTTVAVVVAASDIQLGTRLSAEMLGSTELPVEQATDTYRSPTEVVGQVVRRTIAAGQVLRPADFTAGEAVEIAGSIPAGMRAVAIPLDKVTSVGFLVQPGDYVDVMLAVRDEQTLNEPYSDGDGLNPVVGPSVDDPEVYENKDGTMNNTTIKVLVQRVQVLAVLPPPDPTDATDQRATALDPDLVAVLAVTPQQAELVRFAVLDGNISLLLRSPGDSQAEDVATTGVTLRFLVDSYGVLPPGPVTSQPVVPIEPFVP